ncbi:MAG: hypothetical protein C0483_07015 [Pirellula sp.]|nr:hypothetical protein [Pirellula sp.]
MEVDRELNRDDAFVASSETHARVLLIRHHTVSFIMLRFVLTATIAYLPCLVVLLACSVTHAQDQSTKVEPVTIGPFAEGIIWPISGSTKPDAPYTGTFGPRQLSVDGFRHDFNRGIEISCQEGTPIHAVADGEVRVAGKHEAYQKPLVQLRHKKADSKEYYYTNYMNMGETSLTVGQMVAKGDVVGKSGRSPRDFEIFRFEVRDGGSPQRFCIHPLGMLPYADSGPPNITIDSVAVVRDHTTIAVTTTVPGDEMDLLRVDVVMLDDGKQVAKRSYDLNEWNRAFTPAKDGTKILDQQLVNHVSAEPGRFQRGQSNYELTLVFDDFPVVKNKAKLVIQATATDARGNVSKPAERKNIR